jgi:ribosome assembly protein 4
LWDAQTGKQIGEPLQGHDGRVTSVVFSPDGNTIITGSDDCTIRLCDSQTSKQIGEPLKGHNNAVNSVKISPDMKTIVSASLDKSIRIHKFIFE